MKLELRFEADDVGLSQEELFQKAQQAFQALLRRGVELGTLRKAQEGDFPVHGKGGEVQALGDLTEILGKTYDERMARLTKDLAKELLK